MVDFQAGIQDVTPTVTATLAATLAEAAQAETRIPAVTSPEDTVHVLKAAATRTRVTRRRHVVAAAADLRAAADLLAADLGDALVFVVYSSLNACHYT